MPFLVAAPANERGRRVPAIAKQIDTVPIRNEWLDCFQHRPGDLDFGAKGEPLIFGAYSVELAHGFGAQVRHHIDGEASVTNRQAQQDIDCALGVGWMVGPGLGMVNMPVHRLQPFGAIVFDGEAIIQTEEYLLGYPLFFDSFKGGLD